MYNHLLTRRKKVCKRVSIFGNITDFKVKKQEIKEEKGRGKSTIKDCCKNFWIRRE